MHSAFFGSIYERYDINAYKRLIHWKVYSIIFMCRTFPINLWTTYLEME